MSAANAQVYQRDLVQKTMVQLYEYNHEDMQAAYTKPAMDAYTIKKNWASLTKGMSEEEEEDLENTKNILDNYEKIY